MTKKAILASALLLTAFPAMAATTTPALGDTALITTTDSGWRVSSALYVWTTRLDGDFTFRGNTVAVDVPFSEVFDSLDMTFMGLVEVGKGRWSFMTDLFYAKLGIKSYNQLATTSTEIEQFIGNFAVFYRVVESPSTHLDLFGGARVNWMETDVTTVFARGRILSLSAEKTWVDPIIGVRFHHDFTDKFFIRALADIGGFSIASDFTWQAMAAIGYRLTDNVAVGIGYRGIGTDYTSGTSTYDVISHGLLLGLEYRF